MNVTLTDSMAVAWAARHQKAVTTLQHAIKAPTLFKAEYVAELQAEIAHAEAEYRRWLAQDVAR